MKIRKNPLIIMASVAALLMAGFWLGAYFGGREYAGLLLARPLAYAASGLEPGPVQDFCDYEFPVTYEIPGRATAGAGIIRQPVILAGTNSYYGQIMGYPLKQGAFFTAAAFAAHSKQAVLNEAAARQIFGSYNICGQTIRIDDESWLVVGLLQDKYKEEAIIYVPASITGGQASSLLMLMDDGGVNLNYAQNALKQLGIYEANYELVNMSAFAIALGLCRSMIWRLVVVYLLTLLLIRLWRILGCRFSFYRAELQYRYPAELIFAQYRDMAKTLLPTVYFLAGLGILPVLALEIFTLGLELADIWPHFKVMLKIIMEGRIWHI